MDILNIEYRKIGELKNITMVSNLIHSSNSPFYFTYTEQEKYNVIDLAPKYIDTHNHIYVSTNREMVYKQTKHTSNNLDWAKLYSDLLISQIIKINNTYNNYICVKLTPKNYDDLQYNYDGIYTFNLNIYSVMYSFNSSDDMNISAFHNKYLKVNAININKILNTFIKKVMINSNILGNKPNNDSIIMFNQKINDFKRQYASKIKDDENYYLQFKLIMKDSNAFKKTFNEFMNCNYEIEFRRYITFGDNVIIIPNKYNIDGVKTENTESLTYQYIREIKNFRDINMDNINISIISTENVKSIMMRENVVVTLVYEVSAYNEQNECICFSAYKSYESVNKIENDNKLSFNTFIENAKFFSVEYLYDLFEEDNDDISITFDFPFLEISKNDYVYILERIKQNTSMIGKNPKELCNSPKSLDKINYTDIYKKKDYFISAKTDGVHAILYLEIPSAYKDTDTLRVEIIDDEKEYIYEFNALLANNIKPGIYICEGEIFEDELNDNKKAFIVFDVFTFESENYALRLSVDRINKIVPFVNILSKVNYKAYAKHWFKIEKEYDNTQIEAQYKLLLDEKLNYKTDGIILMINNIYVETKIYKWKTVEQLTIDFYVKLAYKDEKKGLYFYWLLCGMSKNDFNRFNKKMPQEYQKVVGSSTKDFFPAPFMPSDKPDAYRFVSTDGNMGGKIFEFNYVNDKFNITRERTDRQINFQNGTYYGNYYSIAELNWLTIINPLKLEDLWNFHIISGERYFQEKDNKYENQTRYSKQAKELLMKYPQSFKARRVIDIGSGKGQDLYRYASMYTSELFCIEPDADAMNVLRERYLNWYTNPQNRSSDFKMPLLHTINDDISNIDAVKAKINDMIIEFYGQKTQINIIDKIVMNFSVHYYIHNIRNIIANLNPFMADNSYILCVFMNGNKINEMFNTLKSNEIILYENGEIKYQIKKKYSETTLTNYGQEIELLLPFTNGELYSEQLVNPTYLNTEITTCGYKLIKSGSLGFQDIGKLFDNDNMKKKISISNSLLTEADITWIKLYSYAIWQKKVLS